MMLNVEFIENSKELTADFSENEQRINAELENVIPTGGTTTAEIKDGILYVK